MVFPANAQLPMAHHDSRMNHSRSAMAPGALMFAARWFRLPVLLLISAYLSSCATSRQVPRISDAEARRIISYSYSCIVGIEPHRFPAYSKSLQKALIRTNMFSDVVIISSGSRYDIIARIEEEVHGTATVPLLTALTLGIIPTIVKENHGHVFSLSMASDIPVQAMVSSKYSSSTTMGWIALPLWMIPGFSVGDPDNSYRYCLHLQRSIIMQADSILRFYGPHPRLTSR